jgi:hypothetical protein
LTVTEPLTDEQVAQLTADGVGEVCGCCGAFIEYDLDEGSCPDCGCPPARRN